VLHRQQAKVAIAPKAKALPAPVVTQGPVVT